MPFFDFHLHPTLKCMFSLDSKKTSPWVDIPVKAIPWPLRWCSDFEYILCSQSDLDQLSTEQCNLICSALHAPERGMTTAKLLLQQAKGSLSQYLNPDELKIINDPATSPYKLVLDDLEQVLLNPGRFGITNRKVIVLKKGVAYDPNDTTNIYLALGIEGCHSLGDTYDPNKLTAAGVIKNLKDLVVSRGYPIITVNLTHLEQYPLCNHAYGILFVSSETFRPTGKEISPDGVSIVKECYARKILIDLKHMSLGARRFLIEKLRPTQEFQPINQPLVCTHAGFTGIGYADIPDYLEYHDVSGKGYGYVMWNKPKRFDAVNTMTAFNPSSINLYDEDIMAILSSGGIIGLSMDRRILGYSDPSNLPEALNELAFEEEYISLQEKGYFLTRDQGAKMNDDYCITTQEVMEGGVVNPDAAFYHLCYFMSHILQLLKVAKDHNYDPAKALTQVCIGSDFDGIINPIWCCPTVRSLTQFKTDFIKQFPYFASANQDKVSLPPGFDIHVFANQLFYENGKNFLKSRLSLL